MQCMTSFSDVGYSSIARKMAGSMTPACAMTRFRAAAWPSVEAKAPGGHGQLGEARPRRLGPPSTPVPLPTSFMMASIMGSAKGAPMLT